MNAERKLPQATRDLAERITRTYRQKYGYQHPDGRKAARTALEENAKRRPESVVYFDSLDAAARYYVRSKNPDRGSILAEPGGRYLVAADQLFASAIFSGCRMVAFEPDDTDLTSLTTDTIEEV